MNANSLRVALIAGGLSQGGAEKQLVYMARALKQRGADVRCYCLTRGEFYEEVLQRLGIHVMWIGRFAAPAVRLACLARLLASFRPQVVHAGHFFSNLYAAFGARACGGVSIGAIRNDTVFELRENGRWGRWLLRLPTILIANSNLGCQNARTHGRPLEDIIVLPNVIDLAEFDAASTDLTLRTDASPLVVAVGRLVAAKRFDRFLAAMARVGASVPGVRVVIIGEGPERARLEAETERLGLGNRVRFLGLRRDVPALLRQADLFVLSSDHEGFPNVLLEAMAAGLAVVSTPAGDARSVVVSGRTGYIVAPNEQSLAERIGFLLASRDERLDMGRAGRARVEKMYRETALADRLLAAYRFAARPRARRQVPPHLVFMPSTAEPVPSPEVQHGRP